MEMEMETLLTKSESYLRDEEKSRSTINKYPHDVREMLDSVGQECISKELLIQHRGHLSRRCRARIVNGKLSATNAYLKCMGLEAYKVKFLKVQKRIYMDERRDLTEQDCRRLLETASRTGKTQLYFLMLVLCGTGIRISELPYVIVEAVYQGNAEINMKGKYRVTAFPRSLVRQLKEYIRDADIKSRCIFRTKSGKCLDRSNICHPMKKICREARVDQSKVFPHNFRHLFAESLYAIEKNLTHLVDTLGHTSIEITRIYVVSSLKHYERVINCMGIAKSIKIPQNNHSAVSCRCFCKPKLQSSCIL